MLTKKLKKILLIVFTFISACFYLIGNSVSESIRSISSRKPAELKLKVTKKNSIMKEMYIDRESKKVFYFFGNEGLISGDTVNISEKPSDPNFISKTLSKASGNSNEIKVSNYGESKNLKYSVKKGEIKNRAIIEYKNTPKNIYIEFYDNGKKLKKIIKNDFKDIKVENIYGNFNEKTNEIEVKYNRENNLEKDLKDLEKQDKIEIFSDAADSDKTNLKYTIEESSGKVGTLKIQMPHSSENIYLVVFDNQEQVKNIYTIKPRILKTYGGKSSYITWNTPSIDITTWNRKNISTFSKKRSNIDFSYGQEILPNGDILPYINIKMGKLLIPSEESYEKVSITPTNNQGTSGNVLLKNIKNEKISGRVYLTTNSSATKVPVKGLDYNDIENSTSTIEFVFGEDKEADIYLRVYDSPENIESLFVAGNLEYIQNLLSTNSIDIGTESTVSFVEKFPKIEILDLRDDLKQNIYVKKNVIDLSEEVGKNIGNNIVWNDKNKDVDIKLAEIILENFIDKTGKVKNPYLEIETDKYSSDKILISGETEIIPSRYFLKVREGSTNDGESVEYLGENIGYKKVNGTSIDGNISSIKADVYVKLLKEDFELLKENAIDTLQLKKSDSTLEGFSMIFNEDYSDKTLEVKYKDFKVYKEKTDRENNIVSLDGTIFFNEIKDNSLNLVFDLANNSTGRIGIRGATQSINSQLNSLLGNSVFDMKNGIILREYSDTDRLTLNNSEGITNFIQTDAKSTLDGYQSARFNARNMEFELKIWNNTNKIEIKATKKSTPPQEGSIIAEVEQRDVDGNLQNTIRLNLYSSTRAITMNSDTLKIWRSYSFSSEWNTDVEIVNSTTEGSSPGGEGGLKQPIHPFLSYTGDIVIMEPVKGRGENGVENRSVKFLEFTSGTNLGTLVGNKLFFDNLGQGTVRLELTLTKQFIDSLFPEEKPHVNYQDVEVAEIVFGKGKRRVPVNTRVQLRYSSSSSDNTLPTRVMNEHTEKKYYNTGLYSKTETIVIKDITPGEERDVAIITPESTAVSGIIPEVGGVKEFRGKSLKTDIQVTVGSGSLNNAGIYLEDVIFTNTPGLFGIFTMSGGSQDIKEQEIWIPKYSPIIDTQSLNSDFITNGNGTPKIYAKVANLIRYDKDDFSTSIGTKELLGKIVLRRQIGQKVKDIKRNSSTLNIAKLPDKVKLIEKTNHSDDPTHLDIIGYLSFREDEVVTEVEQSEVRDTELPIYLFISPEEGKKIIPNMEYEIEGEYSAGRVGRNSIIGTNLLYYGLKTDNVSELGLNEYIYEPVFGLNIKTNILEKKIFKIDLMGDKPLIKSKNLEKTMRFFKDMGLYSIDILGSTNYSSILTSGYQIPFDNNYNLIKVTDLENGRIFTCEIDSTGGSLEINSTNTKLVLSYSKKEEIKVGFSAEDPIEILNIGVIDYGYKKEKIKLLMEYLSSIDPTKVVTASELQIGIPSFNPKSWYLREKSIGMKSDEIIGELFNFNDNFLIFELGEIEFKDMDRALTEGMDDLEGVRVVWENNFLEFESVEDSTIKIQGKIILLDSIGNILTDSSIKKSGRLAVVIDKNQNNYNSNKYYRYKDGDTETLNASTLNKVIRIGRNNYWQGLIKSIDIKPIDNFENYKFLWNSSVINITEWKRKNRSINLNKNFVYGIEVGGDGTNTPYLDINMGSVKILEEAATNTVKIKDLVDVGRRGGVILKTETGRQIFGKIYLKSNSGVSSNPVKGLNQIDIANSASVIKFASGDKKYAEIHMRVYDIEENKKSILEEGVLTYIENAHSTKGIELLEENTLKETNYDMPDIRIVDLRETLKESIRIEKKVLNLSRESGENIEDDIVWQPGNKSVDVKLGSLEVVGYKDYTSDIKNPYVKIDSIDGVSDHYYQVDAEGRNPYRYFLKTKLGENKDEDLIHESGFMIGASKIVSQNYENMVPTIKGDFYIRILKEDFELLKNSSEKLLELKKPDGTSAEITLVFNEDYPETGVKVPLGEFKTLKEESDKLNNSVSVKMMLYIPEIQENSINLILDSKNNSSGNIGVRGSGVKINEGFQDIDGYSVFDMPKGILQNQYRDSDIIEVRGGIDNAQVIGATSARFSVEGYKSIKFIGNNGIKYEVKIWNNTEKLEISMDKSSHDGTSLRHAGEIVLKNEDGDILNKIDLSLYSNVVNPENVVFSLADRLEVIKTYEFDADWNAEVANLFKRTQSSNNYRIGIKGFHSYDRDEMYLQPVLGATPEGVDGRGVKLLSYSGSAGQVIDNRLKLQSGLAGDDANNARGTAGLKLKVLKEWMENRWPNDNVLATEDISCLELVYGNGKRRVSQKIALWNESGDRDATSEENIVLDEFNREMMMISFRAGENSRVGVKEIRKETGVETELINLVGTDVVHGDEYLAPDFELRGKSFKRKFRINGRTDGHPYREAIINFLELPMLKEDYEIGKYEGVRYSGTKTGRGMYNVIIKRYSPVKEVYSLSSSLSPNADGTVKMNTKNFQFYREDIEDRATTSEVIKDIGIVKILGKDKAFFDMISANSTTLNILKLPNKVRLKRFENGFITKEIEGKLSFDARKEVIDMHQISEVDQEKNIYIKISQNDAMELDDKGIYILEAEYEAGRIASTKIISTEMMYVGLETDNISKFGLDEYIYEPIFQLTLQAFLEKDTAVKIFFKNQKPIPKVDVEKGMIRIYRNEVAYTNDILNTEEYSSLELKGYMNSYPYDREDLVTPHYLQLIDESTEVSTKKLINSSGGYADISTILGKLTIGYSYKNDILTGMSAINPMEITTFGVKEYNFKSGEVRVSLDHLDANNDVTSIFSEVLVVKFPEFEPKSWYYNEANVDKLTNNGVKYMKYFTKDKITYPIGMVGLNTERDREITIGADDTIGARIEYTKNIELEDRNDSAHKIQGKIVKLNSNGEVLDDGDIITEQVMLGIEIDITQSGYDSLKTYVLKGESPLVVTSDVAKKPIRIGRNNHWESLVTNIHLRPVLSGDLTLNLTKNYFRNNDLHFDVEGQLTSGFGGFFTVQKRFIRNIPINGTIKVYKWNSDTNPYGEKLVESAISGGELSAPLLIDNSSHNKTNYKMEISKLNQNGMVLSLSAWGEDVLNEKLYIEVSDSFGITSMHKLSLNYTDSRSMLIIDYVNSFAPGYEFAPGNRIPDAVRDSLYLGSILNPKSYSYQNERPQLESINSLKVSYSGDDFGLVNAIQSIKLSERNLELVNTMTGNKLEIEDISFHKISKRYNSLDSIYFEEVYKMKGYIDFRKYLDLEDGHYRGTIRLDIELN